MHNKMKLMLAVLIACLVSVSGLGLVFAAGQAKYGLNDGHAWYLGYKGAYCHYYEDDHDHYAVASVYSNGQWLDEKHCAPGGRWAKADTGLQPNVTDWKYNYGFGC